MLTLRRYLLLQRLLENSLGPALACVCIDGSTHGYRGANGVAKSQVLRWDSFAEMLTSSAISGSLEQPTLFPSAPSGEWPPASPVQVFWIPMASRKAAQVPSLSDQITALLTIKKRIFFCSVYCCQCSVVAALLCLKCCPAVLITVVFCAHLLSLASQGQGTVGNYLQIVFVFTE